MVGVTSGWTNALLLADHERTVRDVVRLVAGTPTVVNHLRYGAFGQVTSETDATAGPRFAYTGQERDRATGLYHYDARYYDPATARFLSRDPLGFAAGDANLVRYAGNDPYGRTDPTGMSTLTAFGLQFGVTTGLKAGNVSLSNIALGNASGGLFSSSGTSSSSALSLAQILPPIDTRSIFDRVGDYYQTPIRFSPNNISVPNGLLTPIDFSANTAGSTAATSAPPIDWQAVGRIVSSAVQSSKTVQFAQLVTKSLFPGIGSVGGATSAAGAANGMLTAPAVDPNQVSRDRLSWAQSYVERNPHDAGQAIVFLDGMTRTGELDRIDQGHVYEDVRGGKTVNVTLAPDAGGTPRIAVVQYDAGARAWKVDRITTGDGRANSGEARLAETEQRAAAIEEQRLGSLAVVGGLTALPFAAGALATSGVAQSAGLALRYPGATLTNMQFAIANPTTAQLLGATAVSASAGYWAGGTDGAAAGLVLPISAVQLAQANGFQFRANGPTTNAPKTYVFNNSFIPVEELEPQAIRLRTPVALIGPDFSSAEGQIVWRHVAPGSPAYHAAQSGNVAPRGPLNIVNATPEEIATYAEWHDRGRSDLSPFTSWSTNREWALSKAQESGGILLVTKAPAGSIWLNASAHGAESQVLVPGNIRANVSLGGK